MRGKVVETWRGGWKGGWLVSQIERAGGGVERGKRAKDEEIFCRKNE